MLTSSIFSPSDCTAQALADFEKLVIEGGAVDPQGLTQRIRNAFRLLFLRTSDGQLVGVGALKHPLPSYHNRVFASAVSSAETQPQLQLRSVRLPAINRDPQSRSNRRAHVTTVAAKIAG